MIWRKGTESTAEQKQTTGPAKGYYQRADTNGGKKK